MRRFFKTVAIVTVFSISEKLLGFLYRIFLSRTIGSEGIGIYQVALSVFALLLTLSCSGTPITVSRLMTKYKAENRLEKVNKVITAGFSFTLMIAVPIFLIFLIGNGALGFIFADDRCKAIFLVVLCALIFNSLYSVMRGVFWGNKDFLPYSIIELLEEICMIVVGILLISTASDISEGAFYAGIAVFVSYIFSFIAGTIVFFARGNRIRNPKTELKPLFTSAAPITAMRTANSLATSLISVILPLRLMTAGFTSPQALSAFGAAFGMAIPLLFVPTTLIGSFTLVLVPEMAENFYKKRYDYLKRDVEKALKFATLISCLFIPVFMVFGEEIGILVFNSYEGGKYLSASAFLMLFMSLSSLSTSMLNSIGLENKTLIFFLIGAFLMLLCIWFLPLVCGIYALLVGFTCVFGLTTVLNLILLHKKCEKKPRYLKFLLLSVLFLIPTSILALTLKNLLINSLGNLFTVLICSAVTVCFNALFYPLTNLVDISVIKKKLQRKKPLRKVKAKS